jgi:hypothetical protein
MINFIRGLYKILFKIAIFIFVGVSLSLIIYYPLKYINTDLAEIMSVIAFGIYTISVCVKLIEGDIKNDR